MEVDETGNPLVKDLLAEPLAVTDGTIRLSDKPGLGIALRENIIARQRLEDPFTIPAGVYSDMVFGRAL